MGKRMNIVKIDIEKDLKEYEELLEALESDIVKRSNLKEEYEVKAQEIINNTDFKELYGANNQKVRDNHVKKILSDKASELKILELSIDQDKRRIIFLRLRIKYGIVLKKCKDNLKLDVLNALKSSEEVQCNCNPCQCETFVKEAVS